MQKGFLSGVAAAVAIIFSAATGAQCAPVSPGVTGIWRGWFQSAQTPGSHVELWVNIERKAGRNLFGAATLDGAPVGSVEGTINTDGQINLSLGTENRAAEQAARFVGHLVDLHDGSSLLQGQFHLYRKAGESSSDFGSAMMISAFQWGVGMPGPDIGGVYERVKCDGSVSQPFSPIVALNGQMDGSVRGSFSISDLGATSVDHPSPRFLDLIGTIGSDPTTGARAQFDFSYPFHAIAVLSSPGNVFPPGPCRTPFLLINGSYDRGTHSLDGRLLLLCSEADPVLLGSFSLPAAAP